MTPMALALFATCLGVCLYVYAGYPALVWALGRLRPRPVHGGEASPTASVIVPVHNEQAVIEEKLRNTVSLEYPPDRLEVLVASDGSTDRTHDIVGGFPDPRVRLLRLERQGKAHALNEAAREARGDVLVFTDANSSLERDSLRHLLSPFADPEVGGVCGNKRQRSPAGADATEEGEGLYWRYDKWQKAQESRLGSIFAADGTLYAVRRTLFVPIGDSAQADDIAISVRVVLQGYRLLYEPRAVVWEESPAEGRAEFRRKVRVTNHSVRALLGLGPALWTSGFYSVELLSHKLLRHLVPFFLVPLFFASAVLAGGHPLLGAAFALQVLFYASAVAGFALRRTRIGRARLFTVPYYFCLVNAAALLGVLSIVRGERLRAWAPRGGLAAGGDER